MGMQKPLNGAWEELESNNAPKNGAWEELTAVCKPVNGAWQIIWRAITEMIESDCTLDNGAVYIRENGLEFYFTKSEDYYNGTHYGDIGGTGDITFYLSGEWTNPTISFDYEGGMCRSNSTGTTWYTGTAGYISIYSRTTSGTVTTKKVVSSVGKSASGANIDTSNEVGSYSTTLEGTYNRLGISIHITGYSSSTYYNATVDMIVKNLKFNKNKIGFPASSEIEFV